jgi:hypothetical protein
MATLTLYNLFMKSSEIIIVELSVTGNDSFKIIYRKALFVKYSKGN